MSSRGGVMKWSFRFAALALALAVVAPAGVNASTLGSAEIGPITFTVTAVTVDPRTGTVTVQGTTACDPSGYNNFSVSGTIATVTDRQERLGWSQSASDCVPFSIEIQAEAGSFHPGPLHLVLEVVITSGLEYPHTQWIRFDLDVIALPNRVAG
jgi:hypothetical protein